MTDRERFEAWAVSEHFAIHRNGGEQYVNTATHHAWAGWQASRKQALSEAWKGCISQIVEGPTTAMEGAVRNRAINDCIGAIRSLATPEGEQG